jgi:predicted ester cyclase
MENNIQSNKKMVWELWQAIDSNPKQAYDYLKANCHHNVLFDGPHPINRLADPDGIAAGYWQPFHAAFPDLTRRPYIFMGGKNFDGTIWVASTGDFIGTFANEWLGIPASGNSIHLRYGEFCKIYDNKISEIILLLDIPDLLRQLGYQILPPSLGNEIWIPGPLAGGGIMLTPQDPSESKKSLDLVESMLFGLNNYNQQDKESMGQNQYWRQDMLWYGPSGIGTTYGLIGFEENHQLPFLKAFPDRKGGHHRARFSEGRFAASTGWPSIYSTHSDTYLGVKGTGNKITMRVMDFWTRDEYLLHENWVFIDFLDLLLQLGTNVLAQIEEHHV